jgi:hypothetical protein
MLVLALGLAAPPAEAQAPTSKVTITGVVEMVTSISKNLSEYDANLTSSVDDVWQSRTRFRPTVKWELDKASMVFGLEVDTAFGQTGATDTTVQTGISPVATAGAQRTYTTSAFDLGGDTIGSLEVKWLYIDFPLPFTAIPRTQLTIGQQPPGSKVTYKPVSLSDDFPGITVETAWTPQVRSILVYSQVEEAVEGGGIIQGMGNGNDWFGSIALAVTPWKGLNLQPVFYLLNGQGTLPAASARQARGGVGTTAAVYRPSDEEWRYTTGVDARWSSGPWSLRPTVLYQFGETQHVPVGALGPCDNNQPTCKTTSADISAWLVNVEGGYRWGAFLFEAYGDYSSGNQARDNLNKNVNFFQSIVNSAGHRIGWSQFFTADPFGDIFQQLFGSQGNFGLLPGFIGFDRYGWIGFGVRATYSLTPALDLRLRTNSGWTAEDVEIDTLAGDTGVPIGALASGITVGFNPADGTRQGDESYFGTDINGGLSWRFAPGMGFDWNIGYFFAGSALDRRGRVGGVVVTREAEDAFASAARVTFSF